MILIGHLSACCMMVCRVTVPRSGKPAELTVDIRVVLDFGTRLTRVQTLLVIYCYRENTDFTSKFIIVTG